MGLRVLLVTCGFGGDLVDYGPAVASTYLGDVPVG
jgi:hypothetical protein